MERSLNCYRFHPKGSRLLIVCGVTKKLYLCGRVSVKDGHE
jgi:hypothetical protein